MQKAGEPENDAGSPSIIIAAVVIHTPLYNYYIDYSVFLGCTSMFSLSGC